MIPRLGNKPKAQVLLSSLLPSVSLAVPGVAVCLQAWAAVTCFLFPAGLGKPLQALGAQGLMGYRSACDNRCTRHVDDPRRLAEHL